MLPCTESAGKGAVWAMNRLIRLLFPPKCMLCGELLGEEEEIC